MPDTTPNLALPLLAAAQAQKHVTHNEALLALDVLLQCAVLDKDLAAPPASPVDAARYIVAPAPTGAWAGQAGRIAVSRDGGWVFVPPRPGFAAFVLDEGALYVFSAGAWSPALGSGGTVQNLSRLGLGTAADAANPFSAKLNAALWTAKAASEGGSGDLRYTLNKEGAGNVLSLLFQSGYSGRLEFGLIGSDNPVVKVSPNGSTWRNAITIDAATAGVELPVSARLGTSGQGLLVLLAGASTGAGGQAGTAEWRRSDGTRLAVLGGSATDLALGLENGAALTIGGGPVLPATDGGLNLGSGAKRFGTVYASGGVVTTSDARLKTAVAPLVAAEVAAAGDLVREVGTFRFLDAVRRKGEARARHHVGLTAQRAVEIMAGHGLDPDRYGFICRDPVPEATGEPAGREPAGERFGLRPDQLALFMLRGLDARLAEIERRLPA